MKPLIIVTSIAAGQIGDTLGRRGTLFSGAVIFVVGGAIQTMTSGFWVMVIGRIVAGFGVGLLSFVEADADGPCDIMLTVLSGQLYPFIKVKYPHQTT